MSLSDKVKHRPDSSRRSNNNNNNVVRGEKRPDKDSKQSAAARRVTAVACLACQRRKSKVSSARPSRLPDARSLGPHSFDNLLTASQCDGLRPACSACQQRGAACNYETADGLTRVADLKHKNHLLTARLFDLERILSKLRSENDNQASNTLARLRIGDDIEGILDDWAPTQGFGSIQGSSTARSSIQSPDQDPDPDRDPDPDDEYVFHITRVHEPRPQETLLMRVTEFGTVTHKLLRLPSRVPDRSPHK